MKLEQFRWHMARNGSKPKPTTNNGLQWEDHQQLAKLTKYIDFQCEFDNLGRCKNIRGYGELKKKDVEYFKELYYHRPSEFKKQYDTWTRRDKRYKTKVMCCCSSCVRTVGWSYYLPEDETTLRRMARYFNSLTGYWRPDRGCILPRQYRSGTCLTYACYRSECKPQWLHQFLRTALHTPHDRVVKFWNHEHGDSCRTISDVITKIKQRLRKEGRCHTRKD